MNYSTLGRDVTAADFSDGTYDRTGLIGLRTVGEDDFALRVVVAPGDVAQTQLGYPARLAAKPELAAFYVDNASVDAQLTLASPSVAATARLGIVDLSLAGSASVTGSATGNLVNPNDGSRRIAFSEFPQLVADKKWPNILNLAYSGQGSVLYDSVQMAGLGGLALGPNPRIEVSVADVRNKMNEALDGQTPTELLQAALYNAFGSYIQDTNGDGQITQDDVVMEIDTVAYQNIEYRVELGGTLFDLPITFGGLDILPLSLDGQIDVGMDWNWNFGFGLNVTDGFYVVTSYEQELSVNLGVSISQDLHGELFFLDADVTSMDDAGLNPQRDRDLLTGQFYVDLGGDLIIEGPVQSVSMHDVVGLYPHALQIGSGSPAVQGSLTFGAIENLQLTTQNPIRLLSAQSWEDTDGLGDTLDAPSIGTLKIGGDMDADVTTTGGIGTITVAGDWTSDVQVGGRLGSAVIGGDLAGALYVARNAGPISLTGGDLSGYVYVVENLASLRVDAGDIGGILRVGGTASGVKVNGLLSGEVTIGGAVTSLAVSGALTGNAGIGGSLGTLVAADGIAGQVDVSDGIRSVRVQGDLSGSVSAGGKINSYNQNGGDLTGRLRTEGVLSLFYMQNGKMAGQVYATERIGEATIAGGNLSGQMGSNGSIGILRITAGRNGGGALDGGRVEAGDRIGWLSTFAASTGTIQSAMMDSVVLRGGFDGRIQAQASVDSFPVLAKRANILSLKVTGGDFEGDLTAGSVRSLAVLGGDFMAQVDILGSLSALTVGKQKSAGGSMTAGAALSVGGSTGMLSVTGDYGAVTTIDGRLKSWRIKGSRLGGASLTADGVTII